MNRLDNLTDLEIKDLDRKGAQNIIRVLEVYIKVCQPKTNVYEISEMYELKIAQKYLMSPFFEKRIKGMSEFKEIFLKVDNAQRFTQV
jgi:hypothetical protein